MRIIDCEQLSDEWWEWKRGRPTASSFSKIITRSGERSKQRTGYLYSLAADRIIGAREETFMSPAMEEGILREDESRSVYAMIQEVVVDQVGFCLSDNERWGCSPDGLVGTDGVLELKNPKAKTAIEYLQNGEIPSVYYQQVQGHLFVTGRDWCDFVSYCPGLPTFIVRAERDEIFMSNLERELNEFCDDLDALCEEIMERRAKKNN